MTSSAVDGSENPKDPGVVRRELKAPVDSADLLEHEYDGIKEYDNPLPRWWVLLFWGSFVFSIGYFFHFHISGNGVSAIASFQAEERIAQAEKSKRALGEAPSEAALATLAADGELMKQAQEAFLQRCAVCHAQQGEGLIGPNLTDGHFIHGAGSLMDIYGVVSRGVPAKGMPAWADQLPPSEVRKLVAFVSTLQGKNLPGKAPEGEPIPAPGSPP